jgi:hypothetical protein
MAHSHLHTKMRQRISSNVPTGRAKLRMPSIYVDQNGGFYVLKV